MRFLLDTHVFLWLLGEPERVAPSVRDTLADRRDQILVSAASALEVATKARLGKLDAARPLVAAWSERLRELDADELPITSAHAVLAGTMTWDHRDSFDRLLAAQALMENLVLVTVDGALLHLAGLRTLTW